MRIGFDFDNTIVSYDKVFHAAALELGLIPAELPVSKLHVRDHLRRNGQEEAWIVLQGDVYGPRMRGAEAYPGALACFELCRARGVPVSIVSHRTKHPFRGPQHDLHASARDWIEHHGFYAKSGFSAADVFFELSKEAKRDRVAALGCSVFIDDLPEFLNMDGFPAGMQKILFDPDSLHTQTTLRRVSSWEEITAFLG